MERRRSPPPQRIAPILRPEVEGADPSLPKSVWHLAEADFVGFRIVRPLRIPSAEEMHRAWNNGVELE